MVRNREQALALLLLFILAPLLDWLTVVRPLSQWTASQGAVRGAVEFLGSSWLYGLLFLALALCVSAGRNSWTSALRTGALALLSGALALGIGWAVKEILGFSRPFETLEGVVQVLEAGGASFPSITTALLFGVALGVSMATRRGELKGNGFLWLLLVVASLGALARVAGGIHWFMDIAAGVGMGVVGAWLVHGTVLAWKGRRKGPA